MHKSCPASVACSTQRNVRICANVAVLLKRAQSVRNVLRSHHCAHSAIQNQTCQSTLDLFRDVQARAAQLNEWTADLNVPKVVWLSGLFNPQSFLTAVMQVRAALTILGASALLQLLQYHCLEGHCGCVRNKVSTHSS
jgi:Dynein heavy chain C-terminal domain